MKELEKFGINMENSKLLDTALTHTSYAPEFCSWLKSKYYSNPVIYCYFLCQVFIFFGCTISVQCDIITIESSDFNVR